MAEVEVPFERQQLTGVRTSLVETRPLVRRIRTVGLVTADERRVRKMQTKISGWIEKLFVNYTGEQVEPGAPLFSVYSPEVVAAQHEYLLAAGAARGRKGQGDWARSDNRLLLDSARTRLAYWGLNSSQIEQIETTGKPERAVVLHSPIGGFVTVKPVYEGMYVTPEMELYTITDLREVWIWADLYEDEIELVRPGQSATIRLASAPAAEIPAVVSYVSPTLETATRTLRVRFDAANQDGRLKPGMYATVDFETPIGEVTALPGDAVIDTGERKVVFVQVSEGRYQPREVRLGRRAEGFYEVLAGLSPGERVVTSAQFLLDSESRLRAAAGGPAHGGH